MSSTGTKRKSSRGTASTSNIQISKKSASCSAPKTEKISKYFTKVSKSEESENSGELSDSPYKNCLNNVKSVKLDNSASELDDFKTPKAINKVSKIVNTKCPPKNAKKRKKTSQPKLRKFVEDNFKHADVNPDHLQMALALSESSYEAENPGATASSQEKMACFKEALEKYGFGCSKNKISVQVKREVSETKKNKKSRYRYVTPILKIRTEEERQSLISSKVSLILAQNSRRNRHDFIQQSVELFCESLKKYRSFKLLELNSSEINELNGQDKFYVRGLNIETSPAFCGRLLKDWRKIPGREPTPERENVQWSTGNASSSLTPPIDLTNDITSRKNFTFEVCFTLTPPRNVTSIDNFTTRISPKNREDANMTRIKFSPRIAEMNSPDKINESLVLNSSTYCGDFTEHDSLSKYRENRDVISPNFEKNDFENLRPSSSVLTLSDIGEPHGNTSKTRLRSDISLEESFRENQTNKSPLKESRANINDEKITSPTLSINKTSPSNSRWENSQRQGTKRSFDCVSPDLFESDDEFFHPSNNSDNATPILNRLRGGVDVNMDEIECYDLTQSDHEENDRGEVKEIESNNKERSYHIRLSELGDSVDGKSDLNITDYVEDILSNYKEAPPNNKIEKISTSEEDESQQSQSSVYISDDELNYSSVFSTPHPKKKVEYQFSEDEDFLKEVPLAERIKQKWKTKKNISDPDKTLPYNYENEQFPSEDTFVGRLPLKDNFSSKNSHQSTPNVTPALEKSFRDILSPDNLYKTPNKHPHEAETNVTPTLEDSFNNVLNQIPLNETPNTSTSTGFFIKTKNVTPMADYDEMDTPKIVRELDKFGLKPLKRQKGAKLLKYIYESTHPVLGDENRDVVKKKREILPEPGDIIAGEVAEEGDLIFERKQSRKIPSCAVPLHIVWHNFVMSNPKIRENILLYEPLQLEVLHSMLKDQGYKFNIQDLLTFLDRKCITIRTVQGQHHGGRKVK